MNIIATFLFFLLYYLEISHRNFKEIQYNRMYLEFFCKWRYFLRYFKTLKSENCKHILNKVHFCKQIFKYTLGEFYLIIKCHFFCYLFAC